MLKVFSNTSSEVSLLLDLGFRLDLLIIQTLVFGSNVDPLVISPFSSYHHKQLRKYSCKKAFSKIIHYAPQKKLTDPDSDRFRSVFRWARSSGGAWRAYHPGQRERQEDPKAKINLFIPANPTIGKTLSKDPILGIARKGRIGSQSWYHTNSGRTTCKTFTPVYF